MNIVVVAPNFDIDESWRQTLNTELPWVRVVEAGELPDGEIDAALVDEPQTGWARRYPNLKLILSLSAGVDVLLSDHSLPDIPIIRLVPTDMASLMSEYVVYHVLRLRRGFQSVEEEQRRQFWKWHDGSSSMVECRVGLLGLGRLGSTCATTLTSLGASVAGWSRTLKEVPGVVCYTGDQGLEDLLSRTEILVCILPLTTSTRGILSAGLFAKLPRQAAVINVSRGQCLIEGDLIRALESGHLSHAVLDVFDIEPLPIEHPFWRHPKVTVTPHLAAYPMPRSFVPSMVNALRGETQGSVLAQRVDRVLGY